MSLGSLKARRYHSVIFVTGFSSRNDAQNQGYQELIYENVRNTWDDWHLIPTSRPEFNVPAGKQKYVDIPGRTGTKLDLSETLSKRPLFENRTGTLNFYVDNDYGNWETRYNTIRSYIHGKKLYAILGDEPSFFYQGRFKINEWKSNKDYSTIALDYSLLPYKRDVFGSLDDWLWDPFDFLTGVINRGKNITINGSTTIGVYSRQEQMIPVFICSAPMTVHMNGENFFLPIGRTKNPLMSLKSGNNTIVISGNGTVDIEYRGGML